MRIRYYQNLLPDEFDQLIEDTPVAFFPLGTLEYHGPHLPIGNDALKAQAILERVCEKTGGAMVPALYWGIGGGHKEYPTSLIVRDELLGVLLDDILVGLYRNGFRVFVLLTGHYPGEQIRALKEAADGLQSSHPDAHVWALAEYEAYPNEFRGDHAAKWETSILQYLYPEMVALEKLVGAGEAGAPRATHTLEEMNAPGSLHGILGENPVLTASVELGRETVDEIVRNITDWVTHALRDVGKL